MKRKSYVIKAAEILCENPDLAGDNIEAQVELIVAQAKIDGTELIDYVNEVVVWDKREYSTTCDEFLTEIGYK